MLRSWTTTERSETLMPSHPRRRAKLPTVHPGELLKEEFLDPMGITPYRLAKELHVPPPRVNDIVLQRRGISADTALRLGKYFGTTPQFWLNAQALFDLRTAENDASLDEIVPYADRASA
jgi:antitoxin HigA-1